jgi:cleavage and polyadenylation specificity factor subunit 4
VLDQNCCLKHVDEEEKAECIFFKQGFCRHGPACRFRHIKRPPDACPETADFSLGVSPLYGVGDNPAASQTGKKRKVAAPNQYYKIIMCKHWLHTGHCPYGEDCHYGKRNAVHVIVAAVIDPNTIWCFGAL